MSKYADLCERLRQRYSQMEYCRVAAREAADAIEHLQKRLAAEATIVDRDKHLRSEYDMLREENARLRSALEKLLNALDDDSSPLRYGNSAAQARYELHRKAEEM